MNTSSVGLIASLLLVVGCSDRTGSDATPTVTASDEPVVSVTPGAWQEGLSADGNYYIRWRPLVESIPMADLFDVEVEVWTDKSMGERAAFDSINIDAGMPHHRHGMNVAPEITQRADGTWLAQGMLMHMPGEWQVYVDCFKNGRLERTQWSMWLSG